MTSRQIIHKEWVMGLLDPVQILLGEWDKPICSTVSRAKSVNFIAWYATEGAILKLKVVGIVVNGLNGILSLQVNERVLGYHEDFQKESCLLYPLFLSFASRRKTFDANEIFGNKGDWCNIFRKLSWLWRIILIEKPWSS